MTAETSKKPGKYLYAIIAGSKESSYGAIGIDGSVVYLISEGPISAVVSDVSESKIRPERRHLSAHQCVLGNFMESTTLLPVRFGVIADGTEAVRGILSDNQEIILEQLLQVADKVEMGLHVAWDVPNIFDYFVQTHPELRAARDRLFSANRKPTQNDKIELGHLFDHILNVDRQIYSDQVEDILSPYCFEIKRNNCRNEREVMNLACLVGRRVQGDFEAGIFEAARLFNNTFTFDYNGPWAPYNFVKLNLKL
ncbi:MAG TPA: GvpL/GvpF family gas vesicle protein [Acidobacteriota bacterium]|nr:GvpL/GvpF family gas vesicle protein [Acidobacteriota bacterium]